VPDDGVTPDLGVPALAALDGRRVAAHDHVAWSAARHRHYLVAALPFGLATSVVQRDEHAFCATMIGVQGEDLSRVPESRSRLGRVGDALDEAVS
jgi:hypothetical protein